MSGKTKTVTFTEKQYAKSAKCDDGLDALKEVGIDYTEVAEPLEDVQLRIFNAHRDGHNTITFKTQ